MRLFDRKSLIFLTSFHEEYACAMHQCLARFYYFIRICNHSRKTHAKLIHPEHLSSGLPFQNRFYKSWVNRRYIS